MCNGHYELWHTETANLIGWEDGLLSAARMVIAEFETNDDEANLAMRHIPCGECTCHQEGTA